MKVFALYLAAAIIMVASGCSAFSLLNAASSSAHYTETLDVAYGDLERQRLDVYVPQAAPADAPVIVFFYGGGWRKGSKADYQFVASSLTRAGYVVVVPDYRVYPEVRFPDFVSDAAKAVAWVRANGAGYGANPHRIYLMGHSAGAHIAAMLALNHDYLAASGVPGSDIAGLIGLSGPYDFLPLKTGYLNEVFPVATREQSQPVNFVDSQAPATLLIHGADDEVVVPENSRSLAAKLQASGVSATFKVYDDLGHASIVASLAPPLDFIAMTIDDVVEFVRLQETGELAEPVTASDPVNSLSGQR